MNKSVVPEKILIVGSAWVGDMVMAQSVFLLLRQMYPDAVLDVAAPASTYVLLSRMPQINQVILLPFKHGELKLITRWRIARRLRERGYTRAILLTNTFKMALIPWLARIPVRVGWRRELCQYLLTDCRVLDKQRYPLMIERLMALALPPHTDLPQPYPQPRFAVDAAQVNAAQLKFGLELTAGQRVLALCPGAEFGAAKRWPVDYYAQLARAKLSEGWQIWLFGGVNDRELGEDIMRLTDQRCCNLIAQTTLAEAVDLLSGVDVVVTNDSGLMHIAAALDKPLIAIYGSSSAAFTPPLSDKARIVSLQLPCSPCFQRECPLQHHRCLRDLQPAEILKQLAVVA